MKVAFSIASSVHPEKGRELFLEFCRLDGAKHNEAKSEHLILDAYRKTRTNVALTQLYTWRGRKESCLTSKAVERKLHGMYWHEIMNRGLPTIMPLIGK